MKSPAIYSLVWTDTLIRTARKFLQKHPDLHKTLREVLEQLEIDPKAPSLRLHTLSGNLKGKQAVRLTYAYRIILVVRSGKPSLRGLKFASRVDRCAHRRDPERTRRM